MDTRTHRRKNSQMVDVEQETFGFEDIEGHDEEPVSEGHGAMRQWSKWYLHRRFGGSRLTAYILLCVVVIASLGSMFVLRGNTNGHELDTGKSNGRPIASDSATNDDSNGNGADSTNTGSVSWSQDRRNVFTMDNVFAGDFSINEDTFHFINPPDWIKNQEEDPGLYFTVEQEHGESKFVAKQLYDKNYKKELGKTTFKYDGEEHTVSTVEYNYQMTLAILATDLERENRHSSTALYWILNIDNGDITPIGPHGKSTRLYYALFSPHFNFIYFNHENDLYFTPSNSIKSVRRITNDGSANIFNGRSDWIYEEEVLSANIPMWWAPDDSKFIFAKINDTGVDQYPIEYINDGNNRETVFESYPTPGTLNPTIELFYFNLLEGVLYSVTIDEDLKSPILYYGKFISSDSFLYKVSDRESNILKSKVYDTSQNKVHLMQEVNMESFKGWVEKSYDIIEVPPNDVNKDTGYLDILPDKNGYNHIFYFPRIHESHSGGIQLTTGKWEVSGLVGFEYENLRVFFTANRAHPMAQHIYAAEISLKPNPEHIIILQNPGKELDYYEVEISKSGRYAKMKYLGPNPLSVKAGPLIDVLDFEKTLNNPNVLNLSDASTLKTTLETYNLPITSYKSVILNDGVEINYIEIKPSRIDPQRKYPLLVSVYGGPGSKTYNTKSIVSFEQAVAEGLDTIVLQIEPRGTGGKGWGFKSWAKKKFGYWEPRDVVATVEKYLEVNKEHINTDKVAIWGWSYGGYTTLKTIELDAGNLFKYGIAIAPVTDWKRYDSIYTERFMNSPDSNKEGYQKAMVTEISSFEKISRLFILHGTADDNVHIENTLTFVDKLNGYGISNYDMHIFPNSDHSISHNNATKILFTKLYEWLSVVFHSAAYD
ncbi:Dipeptidyl aminopeptidase A [Nakaseomyces bracarensis]|uniref:Dipeptidyl aminopeptidase A n=1 Tax=Nakaseomyces bracarensis TaxID=273131 RepID=A0ABR4NXP6_9SACH